MPLQDLMEDDAVEKPAQAEAEKYAGRSREVALLFPVHFPVHMSRPLCQPLGVDRQQHLPDPIVVSRHNRTTPVPMIQDIAENCDLVVIALSDCGSCTSCSTHGLNDLDQRGLPGASVLTTESRDAFAKQCASIGFDGASLYVPHPHAEPHDR